MAAAQFIKFFPIFLINIGLALSEEFCSADNEICNVQCTGDQDKTINLPNVENLNSISSQIFFIESTGRDHLLPKHVCTIESALRNAKVSQIIVAMTSKTLHVTANNVTCQLVKEYSNRGLVFRHVDLDSLFEGTPLEKIHKAKIMHSEKGHTNEKVTKEEVTSIHYSDAIRLLLLHKFGGWYSDLDILFLRPIDAFKNVLGCDDVPIEETDEKVTGEKITNAMFQFDAGHPFLSEYLSY